MAVISKEKTMITKESKRRRREKLKTWKERLF